MKLGHSLIKKVVFSWISAIFFSTLSLEAELPSFITSAFSYLDSSKNDFQLSLYETFGEGRGYKGTYTSIDLYLNTPTFFEKLHPFVDTRYHFFSESHYAVNAGIGARYTLDFSHVVGLNSFYDLRHYHGLNFHQLGVGFEYFVSCWEFRVNTYFPLGSKSQTTDRETFHSFYGDFFAVCNENLKPFKGMDAEIGRWFCYPVSCCRNIDIYFALGPYYYQRETCGCDDCGWEDSLGFHARTDIYLSNYISVGVEYNYDQIWKGRIQGRIGITIPLDELLGLTKCCNDASSCGCYNYPRVYREEIMPLEKNCSWIWNWSDESSQ